MLFSRPNNIIVALAVAVMFDDSMLLCFGFVVLQQVSRQAISLLHPIGMQYSSQLLASIAEVWLREQKGQSILQLNTVCAP